MISSNNEIYRKIFNATSPAMSIDFDDVEKQKYYVNPSLSRGGAVIQKMLNSIKQADGERYTLQVLTGHIGCGKTTELKYLKNELEKEDFTVVFISLDEYFKGQYNIETLTALDVLYLIGAKIIEKHDFSISAFFDNVVNRLGDLLPQIREVAVQPEVVTPIKGIKAKFLLRVITEARNNETTKGRFRTYLNGIKDNLVEAINQELETLKKQVEIPKIAIIIDDLDRRRDQLGELFGRQSNISMLNGLNCHKIHTIPLEVKYIPNLRTEIVNYHLNGDLIKTLPMISIWDTQTTSSSMRGSLDEKALKILKKVVLRRAFPGNEYTENGMIQESVNQLFQRPKILNALCFYSGGHLRQLIQLVHQCLQEKQSLPLNFEPLSSLNIVIRPFANDYSNNVTKENLEKIINLENNNPGNPQDCQDLFYTQLVFDYKDLNNNEYYLRNPLIDLVLKDRGGRWLEYLKFFKR